MKSLFGVNISKHFMYIDILFMTIKIFDISEKWNDDQYYNLYEK
jgi:hypothetical protein